MPQIQDASASIKRRQKQGIKQFCPFVISSRLKGSVFSLFYSVFPICTFAIKDAWHVQVWTENTQPCPGLQPEAVSEEAVSEGNTTGDGQ